MGGLSPLLQTDEIKQKIINVRNELHRRETVGYRDSGAVGLDDDVKTLDRFLVLFDNPKMYGWGEFSDFNNVIIVEQLRELDVLNETEANYLRSKLKVAVNPPQVPVFH